MINFRTTLAAALLVACAMAGCDTSGISTSTQTVGGTDFGDEEFTIVLLAFHGPTRFEMSERFLKNTQSATGWKNLRLVTKDATTEMQWGKYRSIEAAKNDLQRARAFKAPATGEKIYAQAIIAPMPTAKVGPPEWDLANTPATAIYTVNIAVFMDVPEANYYGRKKYAVEYCKQLRSEGWEAYYFHDIGRSAVCVGTFGPHALKMKPTDPNAKVNANAEQYEIVDPKLRQIKDKFPKIAVNGREELIQDLNLQTGQWQKVPAKSSIIRIPRSENVPANDRPGNP